MGVAGVIPALSQHRSVALVLTDATAEATSQVAAALEQVDLAWLQVAAGSIDVVAIAALETPFRPGFVAETVRLLGDQPERVRRGRAGRAWAEAHFRQDVVSTRFLDVMGPTRRRSASLRRTRTTA